MATDPIADMLIKIKNASKARLETVDISPVSKLKLEILKILKEEGYILDYKEVETESFPFVRVYLKYVNKNTPAIAGIRKVSRPGLRIYARRNELPRVLGGLGIAIISTSNGIMTEKKARREGLGGEVLCFVW
ncbi:MAG: 30S ribosomal protein S8 [bacterium]